VLTVGTLIGLDGSEPIFQGLVTGFGHHIVVDVLLGILAGMAWSRVWPLFATQQFGNTLNLGMVLGLFALGRYAGGSGLLAELVFGLTLANMPPTLLPLARGRGWWRSTPN
jgi:NhaP-type Na+/H+ or K+/H+ antiporter